MGKSYWVNPVHFLKIEVKTFATNAEEEEKRETLGKNVQEWCESHNKGISQPEPMVTWYYPNQLAAMLSNEILHHVSAQGRVPGWSYDKREHAIEESVRYQVYGYDNLGVATPYFLWDLDLTLMTFSDHPAFSKLTVPDAIFQAITYASWPAITKGK